MGEIWWSFDPGNPGAALGSRGLRQGGDSGRTKHSLRLRAPLAASASSAPRPAGPSRWNSLQGQ